MEARVNELFFYNLCHITGNNVPAEDVVEVGIDLIGATAETHSLRKGSMQQ